MPLLDGASTIGQQLEALAQMEYAGEWELVVADNGSTDEGPATALSWADRLPEVSVVDASAVRGVSHARNVGARAGRGDVIALCDADDVVHPGWLTAMGAAVQEYDMVGGRLEEVRLNEPWVREVRPFTQDSALSVGLAYLPYSAGANFAVRREVFDLLEGWNESLRGGGDDIDFCWRGIRAGFTLGFQPDAVISYRHRTEPAALGHQFRNYGRMEAYLYRLHRHHGMPRSSVRQGLRNWGWIARHVADRRGGLVEQGRWHRKFGHRSGRLRGSLRWRVLYL